MLDFVQLDSALRSDGSARQIRFKYWNASGLVLHTGNNACQAWQDANYSQYLVTVPHVGQGRFQTTTPAAMSGAPYSFGVVDYIDGTLANDIPLPGNGESNDVRFVAGRPAVIGLPGSPVTATVSQLNLATTVGGVIKALSQFQNTRITWTWHVVNEQGGGINLASNTLKFICHVKDAATQVFKIEGGNVYTTEDTPASGIFDTVNVTIAETVLAAVLPGVYQYKVWDLTTKFVYGSGDFVVLRAPLPS